MRVGTTFSVLAATAIVCSIGFVGCTSLGDLSGADSGDSGADAGACTQCGSQCVDLETNTLNCGTCGLACLGGQRCSDSACVCPDNQAFCQGSCQTADRQHCGTTCKACAQDEICTDACTVAPPAAFEKPPLDATGWKDSMGANIKFKIKAIAPNATYECRTGLRSTFTPMSPAWAPCDGATGAGLDYTPTPDSATPEGAYRTELRYRSDTYVSNATGYDFYAIDVLNGVASCPRPGKDDGPHFSDDEYFAAAEAYAAGPEGNLFPTTVLFPAPGSNPNLALSSPHIKIPFSNVAKPLHMNSAWNAFTGQVDLLSLRHHYAMNTAHNLILMRRIYVHPLHGDCRNNIRVGTKYSGVIGPLSLGRGRRTLDCEALVLNSRGAALCMTPNSTKTKPEPMVVDMCFDCGASPASSMVSWAGGSSAITQTASSNKLDFTTYDTNEIQIPARTGQWFKILSHTDSNDFTVDREVSTGSGTGPVRVGGKLPRTRYVLPTGYAHLYEGKSHLMIGGYSTKCTSAGCESPGKVLYLPP